MALRSTATRDGAWAIRDYCSATCSVWSIATETIVRTIGLQNQTIQTNEKILNKYSRCFSFSHSYGIINLCNVPTDTDT